MAFEPPKGNSQADILYYEDDEKNDAHSKSRKDQLIDQIKPSELQTDEKDSNSERKLFQNQVAIKRSWCLGRYFFTWVTPLIKHAKKYRKLKVEDLGDLKKEDEVIVQIEALRRVWDRKVAAGVNQNSLMKAII